MKKQKPSPSSSLVHLLRRSNNIHNLKKNIRQNHFIDYLLVIVLTALLPVIVVAAKHNLNITNMAGLDNDIVQNGGFENGTYAVTYIIDKECPTADKIGARVLGITDDRISNEKLDIDSEGPKDIGTQQLQSVDETPQENTKAENVTPVKTVETETEEEQPALLHEDELEKRKVDIMTTQDEYTCNTGYLGNGWLRIGSPYVYQNYSLDSINKIGGNFSQKIIANAADIGMLQVLSLEPNTKYLFSANLFTEKGSAKLSIPAITTNTNESISKTFEPEIKGTWEYFSFEVTTGNDAQDISIQVTSTTNDENVFYIDDVSMLKATDPNAPIHIDNLVLSGEATCSFADAIRGQPVELKVLRFNGSEPIVVVSTTVNEGDRSFALPGFEYDGSDSYRLQYIKPEIGYVYNLDMNITQSGDIELTEDTDEGAKYQRYVGPTNTVKLDSPICKYYDGTISVGGQFTCQQNVLPSNVRGYFKYKNTGNSGATGNVFVGDNTDQKRFDSQPFLYSSDPNSYNFYNLGEYVIENASNNEVLATHSIPMVVDDEGKMVFFDLMNGLDARQVPLNALDYDFNDCQFGTNPNEGYKRTYDLSGSVECMDGSQALDYTVGINDVTAQTPIKEVLLSTNGNFSFKDILYDSTHTYEVNLYSGPTGYNQNYKIKVNPAGQIVIDHMSGSTYYVGDGTNVNFDMPICQVFQGKITLRGQILCEGHPIPWPFLGVMNYTDKYDPMRAGLMGFASDNSSAVPDAFKCSDGPGHFCTTQYEYNQTYLNSIKYSLVLQNSSQAISESPSANVVVAADGKLVNFDQNDGAPSRLNPDQLFYDFAQCPQQIGAYKEVHFDGDITCGDGGTLLGSEAKISLLDKTVDSKSDSTYELVLDEITPDPNITYTMHALEFADSTQKGVMDNLDINFNYNPNGSITRHDTGEQIYSTRFDIHFDDCPDINSGTVNIGGKITCPNSEFFRPDPDGYVQIVVSQYDYVNSETYVWESPKITSWSGDFDNFVFNYVGDNIGQRTLQLKLYDNNGGLANNGEDIYNFRYDFQNDRVYLTNMKTLEEHLFEPYAINLHLSTCDTSNVCTPEGAQGMIGNVVHAVTFGAIGNDVCVDPGNNALPAITFNATATDVYKDTGTSILSWNVTGASVCYASGEWNGRKDFTGTQSVGPFTTTGNKTYTLTCYNAYNKSSTGSVTISVQERPSSTISGTLECQNVGTPPSGTNIQIKDQNQSVVGQTNLVVGAGQTVSFSINTPNVNLMDGRMYNIRPTGFGPNTGGTYECVQKNPNTNELWAKRNMPAVGGSCTITTNPHMCPADLGDNSGECWQVLDVNNVKITATSCGGTSEPIAPWRNYCDTGNHMNYLNLSEVPPSIKEATVVTGNDGKKYVEICVESQIANAEYEKGFKIYADKAIEYLPKEQDHYWREGRGAPINEDFNTGRKGTYIEKQDERTGRNKICTRTDGSEYSIPIERLKEIDRTRGGNDGIITFNIAAGADRGHRQKKTCKIEGLSVNIGHGQSCERVVSDVRTRLKQHLIPLSNSTIDISWDYNHTGPDVNLTVKRIDENDNETTLESNIDTNTHNYTDTTVESDHEYRYKIIPDNTVGDCTNGLNIQEGASDVVKVHSPAGLVGQVNGDTTCNIKGWALDKDILNKPVNIKVYADESNSSGGSLVGTGEANIYNGELENALGSGRGNHNFEITLDNSKLSGGCHLLYAYADNMNGTKGDNILLPRKDSDDTLNCGETLPNGWQNASGVIECSYNQCTKVITNATLHFYQDATQAYGTKPGGFSTISWDGPKDVDLHIYRRTRYGAFIFDELIDIIPANYTYNYNRSSDVYVESGEISYIIKPISRSNDSCPGGYQVISDETNGIKIYTPEGYVTRALGYTQCSIEGMAVDQDALDEPAQVKIYMDNPYNQGGILLKSIRADELSPDMANVDDGYGNHNFTIDIDGVKDDQCHPLYLYVTNKDGTLGESPIQLKRKNNYYTNGCSNEYTDWNHVPIEWQNASAILHCNVN